MIINLSRFFRNLGLDTECMIDKDWDRMIELAKTEKRIIITKDKKYFERQLGIPCYLLLNDNVEG